VEDQGNAGRATLNRAGGNDVGQMSCMGHQSHGGKMQHFKTEKSPYEEALHDFKFYKNTGNLSSGLSTGIHAQIM
jgi:hypothetical protein